MSKPSYFPRHTRRTGAAGAAGAATYPKPIRRECTHEVRMIDEKEGIVEYIASDETLDSYGDIILASGWEFSDRFESNPVFLNCHQMWQISDVIGRVINWEIRVRQLVERVKWAIDVPGNADAQLGFQMTLKGYLKAVSVGFIPTAWTRRSDDEFTGVANDAGISGADRDAVRTIYTGQQQMELSACPIGANPAALAKAISEGEIAEELAFKSGIRNDTDFEFLERTGAIIDSPNVTPEYRDLARLTLLTHVGNTRGQQNLSTSQKPNGSATPTSSGRGVRDYSTRAQREETERSLKAIQDSLDSILQTK